MKLADWLSSVAQIVSSFLVGPTFALQHPLRRAALPVTGLDPNFTSSLRGSRCAQPALLWFHFQTICGVEPCWLRPKQSLTQSHRVIISDSSLLRLSTGESTTVRL